MDVNGELIVCTYYLSKTFQISGCELWIGNTIFHFEKVVIEEFWQKMMDPQKKYLLFLGEKLFDKKDARIAFGLVFTFCVNFKL